MEETITIPRQFNGPPDSGNGGYLCGLLGKYFPNSAAEVTLHVPPPLEKPLRLHLEKESASLWDGETRVGVAKPISLELDVPEAPQLRIAEQAVSQYRGFHTHSFPSCFVCGPERAEGDGLRIFTGAVPRSAILAAPWIPDAQFEEEDGAICPEVCWAALDCPGAFAIYETAGGEEAPTVVLGRMTGRLLGPVVADAPHVVISWSLGNEGRKYHAGTAIYSPNEELLAWSRQTWIAIKK